MADMTKEEQEKIQMLQLSEKNLQNLLNQRQQFQVQLSEFESALEELKKTDKAYKIIGNIMVASDKAELEKDINEKINMINLRVKNIEKQEKSIREKSKKMQEDILSKMKGKDE